MNAIIENIMPKVPENFKILNGLKIDQVAIATMDSNDLVNKLKFLGLDDWISDIVVAEGTVRGIKDQNTAILNFNYQMGIEFEVLQYTSGQSWHDELRKYEGCANFLSHIGYHLKDKVDEYGATLLAEAQLQEIKRKFLAAGYKVAQEVLTLSHTNQYLIDQKRKYHYIIFDTRDELGFDVKLIVRRENA